MSGHPLKRSRIGDNTRLPTHPLYVPEPARADCREREQIPAEKNLPTLDDFHHPRSGPSRNSFRSVDLHIARRRVIEYENNAESRRKRVRTDQAEGLSAHRYFRSISTSGNGSAQTRSSSMNVWINSHLPDSTRKTSKIFCMGLTIHKYETPCRA